MTHQAIFVPGSLVWKVVLLLKGRVLAIRASIGLVVVSFCLVLFIPRTPDIVNSIFIGVGSSAIVTLIVYVVEYLDTKTRTLENMWSALHEVNAKLHNVPYLHFDEPLCLVKECYQRMQHDGFRGADAAKQALTCYYLETDCIPGLDDVESYRVAVEKASKRLDILADKIEKAMDQYVEASHTSLDQAYNTYGEIGFLLDRKKQRQINMHRRLVEPLRAVLQEVISAAYHFRLHKSGEGRNLAVMSGFIMELQGKFFRVEHADGWTLVYRKRYDSMSERLEQFRASIYGQEPELSEPTPCLSIWTQRATEKNQTS